eukprot:6211216-Pleurochrysis_carterae.AAC.3
MANTGRTSSKVKDQRFVANLDRDSQAMTRNTSDAVLGRELASTRNTMSRLDVSILIEKMTPILYAPQQVKQRSQLLQQHAGFFCRLQES